MTASVRFGDICSGHIPCYPSRPNDQGSPNVFVNGLPKHRLTDHWVVHCLAGSTKIRLLSGNVVAIEDLVDNFEGEFVYSCTPDGRIVPGKIIDAFISAYTDTLSEIHLDNGKKFRSTTDHLVMLRDGSYDDAGALEANDSLMPLYRRLNARGYEEVWDNESSSWITTHKMSAQTNMRQYEKALRSIGKRGNKFLVVHHKNFKKRDNRPTNLKWMGVRDHFKWHSTHGHNIWLNHSPEKRAQLCALMSENAKRSTRKAVEDGTHNFVTNHPMKLRSNKRKISESNLRRRDAGTLHFMVDNPMWDPKFAAKSARAQRLAWKLKPESEKQRKSRIMSLIYTARVANGTHHTVTDNPMKKQDVKDAMCRAKIVAMYKAIRSAGLPFTEASYKALYMSSSPGWEKMKTYFKSLAALKKYVKYNHKVTKVETIVLDHKVPVYDLTIQNAEGTHNFALACGVFVHNCCGFCHDSQAASGSPNVFTNRLNACRIGDAVACGSSMVSGSPNVFINGGG